MIIYKLLLTVFIMSTQCLQTARLPEPTKILVGSTPVKEREKLLIRNSWEDLRGLTWVFHEDWS
ncbi:MAG: hypothetical protein P8X97_08160 [Candidatus Bathyarchaeota archaeon]